VPITAQQLGWFGFVQSALSRQIVWFGHEGDVPHAICVPAPSQHGKPAQSSVPSHVAEMPAQVAPMAMHDGVPRKSAQHFWPVPQVIVPHATPTVGTAASIVLLPLPSPLHTPSTQGWPAGHG